MARGGTLSYDIEQLRRDIVFETTLRERTLIFHTRFGLFSPRGVDEGTRLLLDHIEVGGGDDCVDLGCGYGPIGVTLAAMAPGGRTVLVDRDVVATEYARTNVAANSLGNCEVQLSDGFRDLEGQSFDLVVSNLPAKAGNEALYLLLADAQAHLRDGGRCYVVTLSGMRRFIERSMVELFGNYEKVKQGRTHTVALAVRARA